MAAGFAAPFFPFRQRSEDQDDRLPDFFAKLADSLEQLPDWNHDACDHALRALAESEGVKAGLLINATRVAIVGRAVAPPLFDTMAALGQKAVVDRLRRAIPAVRSAPNVEAPKSESPTN